MYELDVLIQHHVNKDSCHRHRWRSIAEGYGNGHLSSPSTEESISK